MVNVTVERKHVYLIAIIAVVAAVLVPVGAWASHQFSDVPDSNPFHDDIAWVKDAGVTLGCGDGTTYCPSDSVTREQMAAFMKRLATNQVVDARTNSGLSIVAAGMIDSAGAIRSGTGNFTVAKTSTGTYQITISGTSFVLWNYVTSATASTANRRASADSVSGKLQIYTTDAAGTKVDGIFNFVVYDPTP